MWTYTNEREVGVDNIGHCGVIAAVYVGLKSLHQSQDMSEQQQVVLVSHLPKRKLCLTLQQSCYQRKLSEMEKLRYILTKM